MWNKYGVTSEDRIHYPLAFDLASQAREPVNHIEVCNRIFDIRKVT